MLILVCRYFNVFLSYKNIITINFNSGYLEAPDLDIWLLVLNLLEMRTKIGAAF